MRLKYIIFQGPSPNRKHQRHPLMYVFTKTHPNADQKSVYSSLGGGGGIFVTTSLFAVSFRQSHFCDPQRARQKSFRREGQAREVMYSLPPREALPTEAGGRAALRNSCRRRSPFCIAALEAREQFESQMRDSPLRLGEVEGGQSHGVHMEEEEAALSPHSL